VDERDASAVADDTPRRAAGQRRGVRLGPREITRLLVERKWLVVGFVLGAVMQALPTPPGLTHEGMEVLTITVVATLFFITEAVPLPTVALMIAVFQVLLLGIPSKEVARSFMSDSVFFIMGSLMLAVAIVKQNLDRRIALFILNLTGPKISRIVFGVVTVSAIIASFIGEHTVAAMMLPVGITLVRLTADKPRENIPGLAALLMFSIAYGCSIAGIGTPSGGARNAIMMGYWSEFGIAKIGYLDWMIYCYPMVLVQIPFLVGILLFTFRPEIRDLTPALTELRRQVEEEGPMSGQAWLAIFLFALTLVGWITISGKIGMGTVALIGVCLYLSLGLVKWEDISINVNWGVVLLYGAAISLGVQMKDSGAAEWVAKTTLDLLAPLGAGHGIGLVAAVSGLTTLMTNTMSNGAAVAVLGPITLNMAQHSGDSPVAIGLVTAVSSAFAYFTVVGTPACTIVYASGYLKTTDFLRVGWRMFLASFILILLMSQVYWSLFHV